MDDDLTVTLPADMIEAMQAEADDRQITVDDLVADTFSHVHNRVDPAIKSAS